MTSEDVIICIDPADGDDSTAIAVMRVINDAHVQIESLCCIPPSVLSARESTAAVINALMEEATTRLEAAMRAWATYGVGFWKMPSPPQRRRWDRYGAYHKRLMKKFWKNPWRYA